VSQPPIDFQQYSPWLIAWLYGFRGKIWREVEWHQLTSKQLHQFLEQSASTSPDPSMALTQSKKFWFGAIPSAIAQQYHNPSLFEVQLDATGVSTRFGHAKRQPAWAFQAGSPVAYFHRIRFAQLKQVMQSVCGVRSIQVCGSHALGIASQSSDIDVVVSTYPGMALYVRFWLKCLFKLARVDIHSLHWEILGRVCTLLRLRTLHQICVDKQMAFHSRAGLKIDAGIITDSPTRLDQVYPYVARNAWLWWGVSHRNSIRHVASDVQFDVSHTFIPSSWWLQLWSKIVQLLSTLLFPLLYPVVVVAQLLWSRWLQKSPGLSFGQCVFFTQDFPPEYKNAWMNNSR